MWELFKNLECAAKELPILDGTCRHLGGKEVAAGEIQKYRRQKYRREQRIVLIYRATVIGFYKVHNRQDAVMIT